jgi:hypothetical protein
MCFAAVHAPSLMFNIQLMKTDEQQQQLSPCWNVLLLDTVSLHFVEAFFIFGSLLLLPVAIKVCD